MCAKTSPGFICISCSILGGALQSICKTQRHSRNQNRPGRFCCTPVYGLLDACYKVSRSCMVDNLSCTSINSNAILELSCGLRPLVRKRGSACSCRLLLCKCSSRTFPLAKRKRRSARILAGRSFIDFFQLVKEKFYQLLLRLEYRSHSGLQLEVSCLA